MIPTKPGASPLLKTAFGADSFTTAIILFLNGSNRAVSSASSSTAKAAASAKIVASGALSVPDLIPRSWPPP